MQNNNAKVNCEIKVNVSIIKFIKKTFSFHNICQQNNAGEFKVTSRIENTTNYCSTAQTPLELIEMFDV